MHHSSKPLDHSEMYELVQESDVDCQDYHGENMDDEPENCDENQCSLNQSNDYDNRRLFDDLSKKYFYDTGTSGTYNKHLTSEAYKSKSIVFQRIPGFP